MPIVADESRTFGMEGMFRQLGIYSSVGQLYHPQDAEQLMWYREDKLGQILQEGINEAGALSSWIAAGTSYSNHDLPMIPFYIFYSMFGFQRVGDLTWAAGDSRTRGFLLGATSGRTTLNGEGLQHEDGSSQVAASFVPNCRSYDPTFAYEVAVIVQDGLRRMLADQEDVYYYITLMNENYQHPAMPDRRCATASCAACISCKRQTRGENGPSARAAVRLGSDSARGNGRGRAARIGLERGRRYLERNELQRTAARRRCGTTVEHAASAGCAARSYVEECLDGRAGPGIAATDYIRTFADQIRPFVGRRYVALGTDGYGRSDFRSKLREFFEVDRHFVTVAALQALAEEGTIPKTTSRKRSTSITSIRTNPIPSRSEVMSNIEVRVPDIGDFKDVPVIEVLVKPGDRVKKNDSLVTLESEKASMEVPSEADGVVQDVKVKVGDKVSQGSPLLVLADAGGTPSSAPAPPSASPSGDAIEVRVPDIGDFKDVPVIEVLVKPGDRVKKNDSLVTLESEKASMEVPSEADGVVQDVKVKVGDKVSQGSTLLVLASSSGPTAPPPAPAAPSPAASSPVAQTAPAAPQAAQATPVPAAASGVVHAGPSVRKFARELGVGLQQLRGTGPNGRVTREDVQGFVKGALQSGGGAAATPSPAFRLGRSSTSRNTARRSAGRSRASSGFPDRTFIATGYGFRTSPTTTKPT